MGVTGLWTVVKPCARPIKLETLNRQKLAVDASIWIYQFLKAVRDKEGNALRNSHVVGFFRRICKLLYYGIKPVFVFDGGAPALKRETIAARHRRREGRREDAVRTAGRLLAVQVQRLAEEEEEKRKRERRKKTHPNEVEEEPVPENPVYVEELLVPEKDRVKPRSFRKQDQYHLPELETSLEEMGAPNDPRIMSREELEDYARQFHAGEDVNLYDFSKIDFDGPFFQSLPATDRYNILNAARLRSRIRMGYSREQLETMFPDRMAFSRFQIERVKERNDLTQRLMNLNGMNDASEFTNQRIAGERGREYVLVKGDESEGGWVLGVLNKQEEGKAEKPIDVDKFTAPETSADGDAASDDPEDDEFEDVLTPVVEHREHLLTQRPLSRAATEADDDSLFVEEDVEALFRKTGPARSEVDNGLELTRQPSPHHPPEEVAAGAYLSTGTPSDALLRVSDVDEDEDEADLFSAALQKAHVLTTVDQPSVPPAIHFDGPLPFESIKFTIPKKNQTATTAGVAKTESQESVEAADTAGEAGDNGEKPALPLPPWFATKNLNQQFFTHDEDDLYSGVDELQRVRPDLTSTPLHKTTMLDAADSKARMPAVQQQSVIDLASSEDEFEDVAAPPAGLAPLAPTPDLIETVTPPLPQSTIAAANEAHSHHQALDAARLDVQVACGAQATPKTAPLPKLVKSEVSDPPASHLDIKTGEWSAHSPIVQVSDEPADELSAVPATDMPESTIDPILAEARFPKFEPDYSDPEEEELLAQLAEEAHEHARFASSLNARPEVDNARDYEAEIRQLRSQQKKDRRDADEVSHIMIQECQQLLRLFGLPYITAPMEAEAQCAELVRLGLVDGVVTDDSDVFLFGGTRVYKNMFNQAKFVECYLAKDLEDEYGLTREKLIRFAHLLGSDYTEGIPNVGPVTALEILTEFDTLEAFRDWWTQVQRGIQLPDDTHSDFRRKFRKSVSKLFLPPHFPDARVDAAYLKPDVDDDRSGFQWGVPDLPSLRAFLMSTVGWSPQRTDEILLPVIRDINRREQEGTQSNITAFFPGQLGAGVFAPRRKGVEQSRMQKAFGKLQARQRGQAEQSQTRSRLAASDSPQDADNLGGSEGSVAPAKRKRKSPS
ncbi:DNA repair protein rad2 [Ascosphaera acerosa]|nr:DNA repair protein rad2 [Ascosphaera acerosa]